jgi:hypothetical protein
MLPTAMSKESIRVLVVIIRRLQLAQKFSEGMRYVVEFL